MNAPPWNHTMTGFGSRRASPTSDDVHTLSERQSSSTSVIGAPGTLSTTSSTCGQAGPKLVAANVRDHGVTGRGASKRPAVA